MLFRVYYISSHAREMYTRSLHICNRIVLDNICRPSLHIAPYSGHVIHAALHTLHQQPHQPARCCVMFVLCSHTCELARPRIPIPQPYTVTPQCVGCHGYRKCSAAGVVMCIANVCMLCVADRLLSIKRATGGPTSGNGVPSL